MDIKSYSTEVGGRKLTLEVGRFAHQANAAVLARLGDTQVLATVVMGGAARDGGDFFPLTVDYEEKYYASGKIGGGRFMKRESRPSDEAILSGRLTDRAIRPLFDERIRREVQVILTILAYDGVVDPDTVAMIGASAALAISDIPWAGPLAGVHVGLVDGKLKVGATREELEKGNFNLVVAGSKDAVMMLEAGLDQAPEDQVIEAIGLAHEEIKKIVALQETMVKEIGKEKVVIPLAEPNKEVRDKVFAYVAPKLDAIVAEGRKQERYSMKHVLEEEVGEMIAKDYADAPDVNTFIAQAKADVEVAVSERVRADILEKESRIGGRKLNQVRPLQIAVGVIDRLHGTAHFQRGETEALTITTLGSPGDAQIIDGMELEYPKRYMHHYNFPPYSTGETKRMKGPGRREIGHGALAERALVPVLPTKEEFPYTIRVVTEILSANGSTSMAATCGSTLSLLNAGVPLKKPVAGIAMGLIMDAASGKYKILTDLQGEEDHVGDMDFKVTGTDAGLTCLQLDIKMHGVALDVLREGLLQAREARLFILGEMAKVIPAPAPMSPFAPRITTVQIQPKQIGAVVGPGGKVINEIIATTGVQIDIDDDGLVMITGADAARVDHAVEWVKNLTRTIEVGETFKGEVVGIQDFGAFVRLLPNKDGLLHISEIADFRVENIHDILKEGDEVDVVVKEINGEKVALTMKEKIKTPPAGMTHTARRPMREGRFGGQHRDRDRGARGKRW